MKKLLLLALLGISPLFLNAQTEKNEKETPFKRNEISLNLTQAVFFHTPQISYEYMVNEDLGVGVSAHATIGEQLEVLPLTGIMPYLRWYFIGPKFKPTKDASGFFLEVNSLSAIYKKESSFIKNENKIKNNELEFNIGLGLGLGWKYVTKKNWFITLNSSIGRNLIESNSIGTYVTGGIVVGKRF